MRQRLQTCRIAFSLGCCFTALPSAMAGSGIPSAGYRLEWISPPAGWESSIVLPYGISSGGVVVGQLEPAPQSGAGRGFVFDLANGMRLLGSLDCLPFGNSFGRAINSDGVIAALAASRCTGWGQAVLTTTANPLQLSYLPNFSNDTGDGEPFAISDHGLLVGLCGRAIGCGPGLCYANPGTPVRWQNGQLQALPTMPGTYAGAAMSVNNHGDIVGFFVVPHPSPERFDDTRAFLLAAGASSPTSLPTLGGLRARAYRVLDDLSCIGFADRLDGQSRAVRWNADHSIQELAPTLNAGFSFASDALPNGSLAVGGFSNTEPTWGPGSIRAFTSFAAIYEDGHAVRVSDVVPVTAGAYFNTAVAINSSGWIVGNGGVWINGVNYSRAFLLIPNCSSDFNADGFLDFTDFDAFVSAFSAGLNRADFNADGFLDFTDFDAFVAAFENGC